MRAHLAIAAAFLAASLIADTPPIAAKPVGAFDGHWAVDVIVLRGDCQQGYSFPVRVEGGTIAYAGQFDIDATGRIGHDGRVIARFRLGAEALNASGRLMATSGSGVWRTSSQACFGRWEARKVG